MSNNGTAPLRKRSSRLIERYLRRVARALGDTPAREKREVLAGLREQIQHELAGVDIGGKISDEEIKLVLNAMDPPESFRSEGQMDHDGTDFRKGFAGLLVVGSAIAIFAILAVIAGLADAPALGAVAVVLLLVGTTGGLVLGIVGRRSVLGKVTIGVCLAVYLVVSFVLPVHSFGTRPEQQIELLE